MTAEISAGIGLSYAMTGKPSDLAGKSLNISSGVEMPLGFGLSTVKGNLPVPGTQPTTPVVPTYGWNASVGASLAPLSAAGSITDSQVNEIDASEAVAALARNALYPLTIPGRAIQDEEAKNIQAMQWYLRQQKIQEARDRNRNLNPTDPIMRDYNDQARKRGWAETKILNNLSRFGGP